MRFVVAAAIAVAAAGPAHGQEATCAPVSLSGEARFGNDAPIPLRIMISCSSGSPASLELQLSPRPVPLEHVIRKGDSLTLTGHFDGEPLTIETRADGDTFSGRVTLGVTGGTIQLRRGNGNAPVSLRANELNLDLSSAQRHADLAELAEGIERYHGNAFHMISRGQWLSQVRALDRRLDALPADQLPVAFLELASLIGDGHTAVQLPTATARSPLGMMWFGDELRVVRADAANADLLGTRIVAVGGMPLATVSRDIQCLIPRGQNRWLFQSRAPRLLRRADVLHYFGLAQGDAVRITAVRNDGRWLEHNVALSPDVSDAALTPVLSEQAWRALVVGEPPARRRLCRLPELRRPAHALGRIAGRARPAPSGAGHPRHAR
jgi:hypothetical protein